MALAFEEADGQLAFRLEVRNTGPAPVEVDPARMRYVSCVADKNCSSPRSIVNPEDMLVGLDQARERERASKANQEVAGAVFMMLDATAGIAATASGDHRAADRAFRESDRVEAETEAASARHDATISGLQAERVQWTTVALRRTTLFPGQAVAGMIYLPLDTRAVRVRVCARAGGEEAWFSFRQEVISAEPVQHAPRLGHRDFD
jgi:hypothetical protein